MDSKTELNIAEQQVVTFSWKRVFKVLLPLAGLLIIAGIIYWAANFRPIKIAWASWVLDSRQHYLSCEDLPFYPQVEKVLAQHQDMVDKLKQLGASKISGNEIRCPSFDGSYYFVKGDIEIDYHSRSERKAIENLLGGTFFGIPYRGYSK